MYDLPYSFPDASGNSNRFNPSLLKRRRDLDGFMSSEYADAWSPTQATDSYEGMANQALVNMQDLDQHWAARNPGYLREMLEAADWGKEQDFDRYEKSKRSSFGYNAALQDSELFSNERTERERNRNQWGRAAMGLMAGLWG